MQASEVLSQECNKGLMKHYEQHGRPPSRTMQKDSK